MYDVSMTSTVPHITNCAQLDAAIASGADTVTVAACEIINGATAMSLGEGAEVKLALLTRIGGSLKFAA